MSDYKPILDPKDIPYRFKDAWNINSADGIVAIFKEGADFINVTGKWWDNKEEIWKAHDFGFRLIFTDSTLEVQKVKVKMPTDDIAIVHARIQILGQTENKGEVAGERRTMFIFVAQKFDEEWLVLSAQNTDITGLQTNIRKSDGSFTSVSYKERRGRISRDLNEEE